MADATQDPLNVPIPQTVDEEAEELTEELDQEHEVGEDKKIEPDQSLQGYQDDLNTGGGNDVIENENYGTTPSDATTMPTKELKSELDMLAIDEHETNPESGFDEDRRETVEDLDEADHRE